MEPIELLGNTLYAIVGMSWKILWALVLGFAISGAIQAFVPKHKMAQVMGDASAKSLRKSAVLWRYQFVLFLRGGRHEPQCVPARRAHYPGAGVYGCGHQSGDRTWAGSSWLPSSLAGYC